MRYWLVVPKWKSGHALRAGCQYSRDHHLWYVEEPFREPFTLADFAAWSPVKHDAIAMQQKRYIEAAKAKRLRKKKRKHKPGSGPRQRGIQANAHTGKAASQPRPTGQSQRR